MAKPISKNDKCDNICVAVGVKTRNELLNICTEDKITISKIVKDALKRYIQARNKRLARKANK